MNNTGSVGSRKPIGDLQSNIEQLADVIGGADGCAIDELHDEVILADIVNMRDVRMIEGGDRASLALEAFAESRLGCLNGDATLQPCIPRFPNLAHAAGAQARLYLVRAKSRAWRKPWRLCPRGLLQERIAFVFETEQRFHF